MHQIKTNFINSEGITDTLITTTLTEEFMDCYPDSDNPSVLVIPLKLGSVFYPLV